MTTYYVQRTTVMVVEITGAATPEEAVAEAKGLDESEWFEMAIDIEHDYIVLDASGKQV